MKIFFRGIWVCLGLIAIWHLIVQLFNLPTWILPAPKNVLHGFITNFPLILHEAKITAIETLLGLLIGVLLGSIAALLMASFRSLGLWILPVLIISQAIPTFAIAPLLVIWFGYGITSKIAAATIMIFFPITSSFYDGLRQTDQGWLDLAKSMNAKKWRYFWYIRIPAAMPSFASGLRVATVVAPIGAIIGEWVGASEGLGFLMLNANARMQIDLMFAGLICLMMFSLALYFLIDKCLKLLVPWQQYNFH